MSDLLTRLAQRALGTAAPALQPRLPSRYADPAPADGGPSLLREESVETEASAFPAAPAVPDRRPRADAPSAVPGSRARPDASPAVPHPAPTRREPSPDDPPRGEAADRHPDPVDADPPSAPIHASLPREEVVERVVDADRPNPSAESRASASAAAPSADARSGDGIARHPSPSVPPVPSGERRGEDGFRVVEQLVDAGDEGLLMPRVSSPRRRRVGDAADEERAPAAGTRGARSSAARPEMRAAEAVPGEPLEVVKVVSVREGDADHADGEVVAEAGVAARTAAKAGAVRAEAVRAAERPVQPVAEERPSERPVVRVTIGRIEVRAAEPAPAPRPAARPGWTPPVLSLDQYLKRESGR